MLTYDTVDTPDGPFTTVERPDGVVIAAGWSADATEVIARAGLGDTEATAGSCAATAAVQSYYSGDPTSIGEVPVYVDGTDFQRAVWDELRAIPAGEVRTYGEVAASIGNPAAVRAVGAACGANAAALFLPCHRVVGASGTLTGFAWGVAVKRSLLERECAPIRP